MDWIKRNLVFVIGAVIALGLLGAAGWYSWSGWSANNARREELYQQYEELKRLTQLRPNPGDGKKVDNIKMAQEQQQEVQQFKSKFTARLRPIPSLPPGTNLTASEFSAALQQTIVELQREATNNSVILPPKYRFSFDAQAGRVTFAEGTLVPLAAQLGEVKVICGVLNAAKVNALDSIRRLRVGEDDKTGPATDYLDLPGLTNELAISVPYEITFRCFTPELAAVLAGLANSEYGLIVKGVNLEVATTTTAVTDAVTMSPVPVPMIPQPSVPETYRSRYGVGGEGEAYRSRYGNRGIPTYPQPVQPTPTPLPMVAAAARTGPQPFLTEKQLKVTMLLHVVKLLPKT
ncbi:MAG TPA: Amuc_1100 family pilus-like protein [Verrucomicrobiae bacterium]|nr:Amuc_1100 family pilus-like protein [Verrucomicrobiae bacterium]